MRIIDYKRVVTVVASEEEWKEFDREYLPSEIGAYIRRRVRATRKSERHSISIKFDYRIADVLRIMGKTKRVVVENQVNHRDVQTMLGDQLR